MQAQALAVSILSTPSPTIERGVIAVRLKLSGNIFTLEVIDNGAGTPPSDEAERTGVGRRLVRSIVAQLGGRKTLELSDQGGTHVTIEFPNSL